SGGVGRKPGGAAPPVHSRALRNPARLRSGRRQGAGSPGLPGARHRTRFRRGVSGGARRGSGAAGVRGVLVRRRQGGRRRPGRGRRADSPAAPARAGGARRPRVAAGPDAGQSAAGGGGPGRPGGRGHPDPDTRSDEDGARGHRPAGRCRGGRVRGVGPSGRRGRGAGGDQERGNMTELVHRNVEDGVATVTLDSPRNRNALSARLLADLDAHLKAALADDAVRVIVLTGTGPVFCSGADLKEQRDPDSAPVTASMPDVLTMIWESPKPVVCRLNGTARAGGIGLVTACDFAIAPDTATFAFSEVRLGVVPAMIAVPVLRRVNPRAAAEYFMTG